jgi:hypothetical protein
MINQSDMQNLFLLLANRGAPELAQFSSSEARRTATKASCGMLTRPNCFIFFLPSFCFSSSLR